MKVLLSRDALLLQQYGTCVNAPLLTDRLDCLVALSRPTSVGQSLIAAEPTINFHGRGPVANQTKPEQTHR